MKTIAHRTVACLLVFCMVNLPVWALEFNSSTGTKDPIAITGGTGVEILQNRAIIDWENLNTDPGEILRFFQGNNHDLTSAFAVLNKVTGGDITQFNGILQGGKGHIFVINQQGLILGSTADINAGRFTASTLPLQMLESDFLNPNNGIIMSFKGDSAERVELKSGATINANRVELLARQIISAGTITADDGIVVLAAGDDILITENGSNVAVKIDTPPSDEFDIEHNSGNIHAKHVTFAAAGDIYAYASIYAYDEGTDASATLDAKEDIEITNEIYVEAAGNGDDEATATITANAGGDVVVSAIESSAGLAAEAYGDTVNTANVTVNAGGDIVVDAIHGGDAYIEADTWDGTENNANVTASAGGNVIVDAASYGDASVFAGAYGGETNKATVNIATADGDVAVIGNNGSACIVADSEEGFDNIATIDVDAVGGNIDVASYGGEEYTEITSYAGYGENSNTAEVAINATAVTKTIQEGELEFEIVRGGDVEVIAENGGFAGINAYAENSSSNSADILLCVDGGVNVEAFDYWSQASIEAYADNYYGKFIQEFYPQTYEFYYYGDNTATVGIGAKGEDGILVMAEDGGRATIGTEAYSGDTNSAETVVCTAGDVIVLDHGEEPRTAGIYSDAYGGVSNDAYTGVCAEGDILVAAGLSLNDLKKGVIPEYSTGGHAYIGSYADAGDVYSEEPTSANAETAVVSKAGGVAVVDVTDSISETSEIYSEATYAYETTAYTGVSASGTLNTAIFPEVGVFVAALGDYSDARITSEAYDGFENTADTVVCTPESVVVSGEGYNSVATIKSQAQYGEMPDTATTRIYANEVFISVDTLGDDNGAGAFGGGGWVNINNDTESDGFGTGYPTDGGWYWSADSDDPILFEGVESEGSTLIVDSYENAQDCPECPGCPCGGEVITFPVAPLPSLEQPKLLGCPAEMDAASAELGVNSDELQLLIADAMATNPNLQPCKACQTLIASAAALKDTDGARMAALTQVFNTLAPTDAPFTPEVQASISTAFTDLAGQDSQYALAAEYVDAFVNYVAVLENDLKSPVGDPVALVLTKYGDPVTGSENQNIAAYITAQLVGEGSL